ncbi:MAG TPA: TetR/AcrR family transcriptional regulator [Oligoflexus sp.]|uniref:TetR/AcrR family transcriptional regulator n=1 Tax=Oligoflexus sp. TaxID=1971216 RepID=UPI002D38F1D2|nr:TetR/AcrR family transcriptional regulator [Oligoflexus sp.]HYX36142.1 TetR/AcrR family transcriptional regulator [Oligoflexus sp.]
MVESKTRREAIEEGRSLLQKLGFNGFSFQDIANRIGIKKPSLYAHFASKEELGLEMIAHYRHDFERWAEKHKNDPIIDQIEGLFRIFSKFARDQNKFCPLTVLSAEFQTLPISMRKALTDMTRFQEAWLVDLIQKGIRAGHFRTDLDPLQTAHIIQSLGFGVQHLARLHQDTDRILSMQAQIRNLLEVRP